MAVSSVAALAACIGHGAPSTDWAAARASVERLAALEPVFIAASHGQPMAGTETTMALQELALRFEEVAVPAKGKYVTNPVRG